MPARHDDDPRARLRADCASCAGLCCVAPAFSASSDFARAKPAGVPCENLRPDARCGIHDHLRERGFAGCAGYDCFGAGQHVVQVTCQGLEWRTSPPAAVRVLAAFETARTLFELLWYLAEALAARRAGSMRSELTAAFERTSRLTAGSVDALGGVDARGWRSEVAPRLREASALIRAGARPKALDLSHADLVGARLRGADLSGADLRGASLIHADLRDADLGLSDLIGADLRGADLRGADLASAVFLTRFQVNTARGDQRTRIPRWLARPAHWSARPRRALDSRS